MKKHAKKVAFGHENGKIGLRREGKEGAEGGKEGIIPARDGAGKKGNKII